MMSTLRIALVVLLALGGAAIGAGCGSSSSSSTPVATLSTSSTGTSTSTPNTTPTTTQTTTTPRTTTTRTETAPAFVNPTNGGTGQRGGSVGLQGAIATVARQGYVVANTSDYHANQTLRVLVGIKTPAASATNQRAFFFVDNRYVGTDTSSPSAHITVVSQDDTDVTLRYALYRPSDPMCCPTGGFASVQFTLNNGKLTPLGTIPSASPSAALSRR